MDTIYALATARWRSGLAVVRVSGPLALVAGAALLSIYAAYTVWLLA